MDTSMVLSGAEGDIPFAGAERGTYYAFIRISGVKMMIVKAVRGDCLGCWFFIIPIASHFLSFSRLFDCEHNTVICIIARSPFLPVSFSFFLLREARAPYGIETSVQFPADGDGHDVQMGVAPERRRRSRG